MSDRVLLCMWRLSVKLLSKKSSWRAVAIEVDIISRSGLDKLIKVTGVYLNRREHVRRKIYKGN